MAPQLTNISASQDSKKQRLNGLDGLRGLAIILVFLNHIDSQYIIGSFPIFIRPVINTVFTSGLNIGVGLLFILSGFLMAYIYPHPKNTLDFLQKRYTRIFPLFITMTLVMALYRIAPALDPILRILSMITLAICSHILWVYGVQKLNKHIISRILFLGFITLQLFAALLYVFVIARQPAIVFNQQWPTYLREGVITLVNTTVTLPLGKYIPMLNGVYWTLVCEVLFYILYPIICVPFVNLLSRQNKSIKIFFLLSLLPFLSAATDVSKRLLGLNMLNLPFFMYFATGISLGYIAKHREDILKAASGRLKFLTNFTCFFILMVLAHLSLNATTGRLNDWIIMLSAFPLTLFVAFALDSSTSISRFFSSKYLVSFGVISYSLYLSHTGIVDTAHMLYRPTNLIHSIFFIIFVLTVNILIAYMLYYLLEKPYFNKRITLGETRESSKMFPIPLLTSGIIALFSLAVFFAFQSNFNLLSYEEPFGNDVIISQKIAPSTKTISLKNSREIIMRIKSPQNKFGIVTADLSYESKTENSKIYNPTPQLLVFQIKPSSSIQWYSTSTYKPAEIGNSKMHPFGFPQIESSKDREFDVKLSLSNYESPEDIYLNITDGVVVRSVNQLNKQQLTKNPLLLFSLISQRIRTMSENVEVQLILLKFAPFAFLIIYLSVGSFYSRDRKVTTNID